MRSKFIPLVAAVIAFPSIGFGLGIRIIDQDPEATARGDAFTATADNPSAIYYNPAGITQLQVQNVSVGAYGIYLQDKYTSPTGNTVRTRDEPQAAPQIFYTYTLSKIPISLGIGVYAPYGFALSYPDNNPFRQLALKGGVTYLDVNPVIAYKIDDHLSIAAGLDIDYADASLERGILAVPNNNFQFKGYGYGAGFNLGIMWQPTPQHSFGLSYHSESTIDLSGHSTVAVPQFGAYSVTHASTEFTFPEYIQGGYSFRPTPDWNFEVDLDWTNWQQLKTLELAQQNTSTVAIPFNWQSSLIYEAGVTRYLPKGFRLSAGYIYSENSIPSSSFTPLVPDSNRNVFSVGLGRTQGKFSWDVAYQLAYGANRTIDNSSVIDDGTYRFISHAVTISFGYHF
jgi:long-chain fatty acid transport protein